MKAIGKNFPKAVVFDLDGTLIETAPDLARALNYVLRRHRRRPVELAQVRHMVGRGGRALIEAGFAGTGAKLEDERDIRGALAEFLDFYQANLVLESAAFPHLVPALDALAAAGVKLGVCTNKPEAMSRQLLRELGLAGYFPVLSGGDSLSVRKPDPGHLGAVLDAMAVTTDAAIMVGDSITDAKAARAVGMKLVLVRFGYSVEDVATLGADALIGDYRELNPALSALASAIW